MTLWLPFILAGAATYAIRLSVLVFVHHTRLPEALRSALRFVLPASLAAIIVPAVLYAGDRTFDASPDNERLVASLAACAIAWATRSVWLTIAAGLSALWLLQWAA